METRREQDYNSTLKNLIRYDFIHMVKTDSILPAIKKCNPNILTDRDMDRIKATTNSQGKISGAEELLESISCYHDWFPCLIQAMGDRCVMLEPLAQRFVKKKAEMDQKFSARQEVFVEQPPQNDFCLDEGVPAAPAASGQKVKNASVSSRGIEPDGPADAAEEAKYETLDPINRSGGQQGVGRPISHEYGDYVPRMPSPPEEAAASGPQKEHQHRTPEENKQPLHPGYVHGPEYDFSAEETQAAFFTFPGWDASVQESEVRDILQPFIEKDGHYVLWYWTELKRPAISITYDGEVKNFIIHKKPRKSLPGVVKHYFINKNQQRKESVMRLMQYHLSNGIQNTEPENTHQLIILRKPVSH